MAIFLNGRGRKIPNWGEKKCQPTIIVTVGCLSTVTAEHEENCSQQENVRNVAILTTYRIRLLWKRKQEDSYLPDLTETSQLFS